MCLFVALIYYEDGNRKNYVKQATVIIKYTFIIF